MLERRVGALLLALSMGIGFGHPQRLSATDVPLAQPAGDLSPLSTTLPAEPLLLSEAASAAPDPEASTPPLRPLEANEVEAVLAGLPALPEPTIVNFAWPESGPEAPSSVVTLAGLGEVPSAPSSTSDPGPLRVLRYSPLGAVGEPTAVHAVFDRPMVPLGAIAALNPDQLPIRLRPSPPGQWRWLDPTTIEFQPQSGELPKATHYEVEIAADARALDGARLDTATRWRFDTPPLKLQQGHPSERFDSGPDPLILLRFNQRIEPRRLLRQLSLHAGDRRFRLRLAKSQDPRMSSEPGLANLAGSARPGHAIALRVAGPLPLNTDFELRVAAGARSAEGPRRTEAVQIHRFSTYGPLRAELVCGKPNNPCAAESPLEILFSNELARISNDQLRQWISIEPAIDMSLSRWGDRINLFGAKSANSEYRISLSPEIRDVHGQSLPPTTLEVSTEGGRPVFVVANSPLLSLSPSAPRLTVHSRNLTTLQFRIHAVTPEDWPVVVELQEQLTMRDLAPGQLPGRELAGGALPTEASGHGAAATEIDLGPYHSQHPQGQFLLLLSSGEGLPGAKANATVQHELRWLQLTDLALQATADSRFLQVWATDRASGQGVPEVSLELLGDPQTRVRSDASGLARVPLRQADAADLLIARRGAEVSLLRNPYPWMRSAWTRGDEQPELRWHVVSDRSLYRPGERVHAKGWVRQVSPADGSLQASPGGEIRYALKDFGDTLLAEGLVQAYGAGNFDLALDLPLAINLGQARLALTLDGVEDEYWHTLQVEDFRTPEFELNLEGPSEPLLAATLPTIHLQASYYSGGALPDSSVLWATSTAIGHYLPPGMDDWTVGDDRLSWSDDEVEAELEARTDAMGRHTLQLQPNPQQPTVPLPLKVSVLAEVEDLNQQSVAKEMELLLHPAATYVGLRSSHQFVEAGEGIEIEFKVVDISGRPLTNRPIELLAAPLLPDQDAYSDDAPAEPSQAGQRCVLRSDHQGLARCRLRPATAGMWQLEATTRDQAGRLNLSRELLWVGGGGWSDEDQEEIGLIADLPEYEPGATARILLLAPLAQGHGVLRVFRDGLLAERPFVVEASQAIVELPLDPAWYPGVALHASMTGSDLATDALSTVSGVSALTMTPTRVKLQVRAQARTPVSEPGGEVIIDLTVADAGGQALADTEVSLFVVDEAVDSLVERPTIDPLLELYETDALEYPELDLFDSRSISASVPPNEVGELLLQRARQLIANERRGWDDDALTAVQVTGSRIQAQAVASGDRPEQSSTLLRQNFNPLAAFLPRLLTDSDGKLSATIRLPHNLTRYRITAIASLGADRFGVGESDLTAQLPLMARPSPPRFLHAGDRLELPVLVQNHSDRPMQLQVAARASGMTLTGAQGYALTVPAQQRARLSFPAIVTAPGQADLLVAARSESHSDASAHSLPVWTPASIERTARHGVLEAAALRQALQLPAEVWPGQGGLQLDLSTTALQSLQDAYLYLQDYPYACSEQIASRLLASTTLGPLLSEFGRGPDAQVQQEAIAKDISLLLERRSRSGFGLWQPDQQVLPYVSLHVVHALLRARGAGHSVPSMDPEFTRGLLNRIAAGVPASYLPASRRHIQAYALYLQSLNGHRDLQQARQLLAELDPADDLHAAETLGWLLATLAGEATAAEERATLLQRLSNLVEESAGSARLQVPWRPDGHLLLYTDGVADAILLEALIAEQPESDLIAKLVRGLEQRQQRGHWGSTHQNAFVLLALQRYFQQFEATTPDLLARVWLGADYAGEHRFVGREFGQQGWHLPLAALNGRDSLTMSREGEGRLYYRMALDYFPRNEDLEPLHRGFAVQRRYVAMDDAGDVREQADGSWEIRAGARVRVEIDMALSAQRFHVALIDPLPAGLEAQNPLLANVRQDQANEPTRDWFDHQNLRDERAEAFAISLPPGQYRYQYVARATTIGDFAAPPARAEEMYAPETFGRSASTRVRVIEMDR